MGATYAAIGYVIMQLANGFIEYDPVVIESKGDGLLAGKTFAVKDAIDIANCVTGNGHPLWRETHGAALESAWGVQKILDAGAKLVGKTHTDELTYSLAGQNAHYGTPPNPADDTRIPGGSSSGSASVVAAGHVDFALGTDCGGSVRIPASYCGLFGLRPTHGALSMHGVCPLAPSFDTLGWFARNAETLRVVGHVLFSESRLLKQKPTSFRRLGDAFNGLDALPAEAASSAVEFTGRVLSEREPSTTLATIECDFDRLLRVFRIVQGFEAWQALGEWITRHKPTFGPGVAERFVAASTISQDDFDAARAECHRLRQALQSLVTPKCLLCLPTSPGPAIPLAADESEIDCNRQQILAMTAIAGIAGLPQITMPLTRVKGAPMGLSLIGPAYSDLSLLDVAQEIALQ